MNNVASSQLLKSVQQSNKISLLNMIKPGQILSGKVTQLFPNNRAAVVLNGTQLVAQLETALTLQNKYWFQVQSSDQIIRLKVLSDKSIHKKRQGNQLLLDELGIKETKDRSAFISKLTDEQVPFNKHNLQQAISLLEKEHYSETAQKVIKDMLTNGFPITSSIYHSLLTVNDTDFNQQLVDIQTELNTITSPSDIQNQLLEKMNQFIGGYEESIDPKASLLEQLKSLLTITGLNYEHQIFNQSLTDTNHTFIQSLKGLLLQLLQEGGSNSGKMERFLDFLNGSQLRAFQENEQMMEISLQIPANKLGLNHAIHVDLKSYKNKKGQIDPEFCRLHFYLHLQQLKDTIVDVTIQKRNVNITVLNNHPQLKQLTNIVKPKLEEGLAKINYHLSSIQVKPITDPVSQKSYTKAHTQGVDFRI
ncbi:hypothetical protein [Aquibacillus sediminis]|uniref:hypothetical protein n=1 Tax=Aquibacillus sediminis TaxID=2574734 RepID=UPI00110874D1|nr:hypothetical protein [Aquibacillus sediminis]